MTRLTTDDVGTLTAQLDTFEAQLESVAGIGLRDLALRTATTESVCVPLYGARIAAVPISSGEGFIAGFCECVAAILNHLGCDAWVTTQADVCGIQEAVAGDAGIIFMADDSRFVALDLRKGRCIDDDSATADGYVTALEAATGELVGRSVLLLGLGPVGRAAARRLVSRGALVEVVEPDAVRLRGALDDGLKIRPVELVDGLSRCELIFDATTAAGIIDVAGVGAETIAAVPGMPSAFTAAAREVLGPRHIHEPLAVGVAVMAARALL